MRGVILFCLWFYVDGFQVSPWSRQQSDREQLSTLTNWFLFLFCFAVKRHSMAP